MAEERPTLAFDFRPESRAFFSGRAVRISGQKLEPTPVFYAYWRFAAERQNIFLRRLSGTVQHLTKDEVLSRFKFTNAYRASDRVSQYLIRQVIYRDDLPGDPRNLFFRILLFKLFNKIETWEYLERVLGEITWKAFDFDRADSALTQRMTSGEPIYSAAYIMPSAGNVFGASFKHQNHLRLIAHLIEENYPKKLSNCQTMAEAYALLLDAPSIGPFLAYQFVTDLNYSQLTDFTESEFVVAGPGALDGIAKCFVATKQASPADVIRYMHENQEEHFYEQGIDFVSLWGRRLQLIDCQNLFCEISKYARVAYPEHAGSAGRTRIKQKFTPTASSLPEPWYPPKWGVNEKITRVSTR